MTAITRSLCIALLSIVAGGCGTPRDLIPDQLSDKGLLIVQVSTEGLPAAANPSLVVDGEDAFVAAWHGFAALVLDPGPHMLNALSGESNIVAPGKYITRRYPVNRPFEIEPGRVTNLGQIILLPSPAKPGDLNPNDTFRRVHVDTSTEMMAYLRDMHPRLFASLRDKTPIVAPAEYVQGDDLKRLRHQLAVQRIRNKAWLRENPRAEFVTAVAGTIARITRDANGKATALQVLETRTHADLSECRATGARIACMKSGTEYLLAEGTTVTTQRVPANVAGSTIHAFGDQGLVLADRAMTIYTSADNGRSWLRHGGPNLPTPVAYEQFHPDARNRFGITVGKSGFYLFSHNMKATSTAVVRGDPSGKQFARLGLPKDAGGIAMAKATDVGLYMMTVESGALLVAHRLHLLRTGSNNWESVTLPRNVCRQVAFEDEAGTNLQAACFGDEFFRSADSGKTWKPIFRVNSLF